jgi:MFS family permease
MAHFGHHLLTAITVPMLPLIRSEFSLDYTQSGLVVSAFTVTYGISQLLSGWLADHIGRRISITVATLGVAVCGLLVGISHTYIMMVVLLGVMGLVADIIPRLHRQFPQ